MSERKKQKSNEEKQEKKYETVSIESIQKMAESVGYSNLSKEIAARLAQDVCYRLRETTQASTQFMKHAKRKKLTSEDFNKALKWSDVEPILGHGSSEPLNFKLIKDREIYFAEEKDIKLREVALDPEVPSCAGKISVKASWLTLEGIYKGSGSSGSAGVKHSINQLSDDLQQYYQYVTKVIVENDGNEVRMALSDLATNPKISGLLPHLVTFVSTGVKKVNYDLDQLTRLLHIVSSLLQNKYLYLGLYVTKLLQTVTYCILEPLAVSINPINDHWSLREYASRLLPPLINCTGPLPSGVAKHLLSTLQGVLSDPSRPLCSHYGAVVALTAIGTGAIEDVLLPLLSNYWQKTLQPVLDDLSIPSSQVREDGQKVVGSILRAAEVLLKSRMKLLREGSKDSKDAEQSIHTALTDTQRAHPDQTEIAQSSFNEELKTINDIYAELEDYLGDSLSSRLPSDLLSGLKKNTEGLREVKIRLRDLVNERVIFDGDKFIHKLEKTEEDENQAKIRFLSRPPKLGGYGREGLRKRHSKAAKRGRSRSTNMKEAFPFAKPIRERKKTIFSNFLRIPGLIEPQPRSAVNIEIGDPESISAVWQIDKRMRMSAKMPSKKSGRRRKLIPLVDNLFL